MVGQASSLSIKNDGQDARRHQVLFHFAITFENPYEPKSEKSSYWFQLKILADFMSCQPAKFADLHADNKLKGFRSRCVG